MKNWIKNQIEKILNKLGYIRNPNNDKWFDKPEITPTRERNKGELWDNYWDEFYEPHYNAWYIRCISKYPKILENLLYKISVYDWDDIVKHMADTNWYWGDNKTRTPNKKELIATVVSLTHSCINGTDFDGENYGGVETGGFKVSIKNQEIIIEFEKKLGCDDW